MNQRKNFENRYEENEIEMTVLTSEDVGRAGRAKNESLWGVGAEVLAYIKSGSENVVNDKIYLRWLCEDKDRITGWIYNLKALTIYKVKCRKMKDREEYFMLVDVLERDLENKSLAQVKEEYEKVIEFTDEELGVFVLDKELGWFEGNVDWLGEECSVALECDTNSENAEGSLKAFKEIYKNLAENDSKFRKFAAKKLVDNANDWLMDSLEDDENFENVKLTEEKFAERMCISEITINAHGEYCLFYDDDDMFWGHCINVDGNIYDDKISDAYISG